MQAYRDEIGAHTTPCRRAARGAHAVDDGRAPVEPSSASLSASAGLNQPGGALRVPVQGRDRSVTHALVPRGWVANCGSRGAGRSLARYGAAAESYGDHHARTRRRWLYSVTTVICDRIYSLRDGQWVNVEPTRRRFIVRIDHQLRGSVTPICWLIKDSAEQLQSWRAPRPSWFRSGMNTT